MLAAIRHFQTAMPDTGKAVWFGQPLTRLPELRFVSDSRVLFETGVLSQSYAA